VKIRYDGRMPGSESNVPSWTLPISPSGLRAQSRLPQTEQKQSPPPYDFHSFTSSSPWRIRREPGTIRASGEAPVPVRRWQRVQWQ